MTKTASPSLRTLGNSDLEITPIGIGTWAIGGGDWASSWGPQDDADSIAAIHRAVDLGVNWIDTAAVYGLGHSEEMVGRAVKSLSRKPYIFTKCSLRWHADRSIYNSLKAESLAEEVEASLKRLQVDTIDLYQIHWPNPDSDIEEGWEALARLQEHGKIRWIGVSNFSVDQMKRAMAIAPITSLQPPYSMLRRAIETEILPFTLANGIGVINYSPMLSGMLTGKMTAERAANLALRRLAPQEQGIQRAAHRPESAPGRTAARNRQRPRSNPWRCCRCLGAAQSRHHRGHRRRAQRQPGGRDRCRPHLPPDRRGVREDRRIPRHNGKIISLLRAPSCRRLKLRGSSYPRNVHTNKNPGRSRGFLSKEVTSLHRCDKVRNHNGCVLLQQLRHACGHAGVD